MRYYETLYILNPNFEQEKNDDIFKEVEEQINKFSQVINHRLWGKKRLAYPIEQHKYGTYMLLQFETDEVKGIKEFDNFMKLNKLILRFQTVRLDKKPIEYVEEATDNLESNDKEETKAEETIEGDSTATPSKPPVEEPSPEKEIENGNSTEKTEEEPVIEKA